MNSTHTPGPWHLNPRGWVVQSTGDIVTRLECSNNKDADARLIAAAPELLAALESIAAIVPAIMSPEAEHGFRYHTAEDAYRVHLAGLINQARTQARAAIARAAIAKARG